MGKYSKHREPQPDDVRLGKLIRIRRVELKISQAELGEQLTPPVSFQQVQKYEKGVNRVSWARVRQIADVLEVPVSFFSGDKSKADHEVESLLNDDSSFSIRLLRAYHSISDETVRRGFVSLMEKVGGAATE